MAWVLVLRMLRGGICIDCFLLPVENELMTIMINSNKILFPLQEKTQCREVGALEMEELIRGVRLGLG